MAHRYKVILGGPYPHLITCTLVEWFPIFVSGKYCNIIIASLRYMQENRGLNIHCFVIMPTHLHIIATAQNDDLSAIMRDFKKFTSRSIYKMAEDEGYRLATKLFQYYAKDDDRVRLKVWKDEFHPKIISKHVVFQQKGCVPFIPMQV